MDLSNKKVLFYDLGIFSCIAERLGRDFAKVYYFIPWVEAFPGSTKALLGTGFENMEKVKYFWDMVDKVDIIVMPDTHCHDIFNFLKERGYPVAGVGEAEILELDRVRGRDEQRKAGLPTQKTMVIKGLDELRETLKKFKDKYVKLNTFRGDIESFPDKDFKYVEPLLNKLAVKLGPFAEDIDFIVEDRIKGIEPGIDAILYKGKVVSPTMAGFEVKGAGYIAKVMNYEEVPEPLKLVSDKLEPILKKMDYNFFFSSEVMCTLKGEGYMIDFCCRMAAPVPSAIQTELIENYSEIIWGMGHGEKVIPKYTAKFGGGAAFYSSWAEMGDWLNVSIDKKDRQWIKFREAVKYGKEYYAVPGASTVCTVIAIGDSVEEVMLKVKERAESVKAYQLDKSSEDFVELKEILEEAKDYGFIF